MRLIALACVVLVVVALVAAVISHVSTVLVAAGLVLVLGAGLTAGDAAPGQLSKREILTAGGRRRRRRLRWAVLRGRTDRLDADDHRICDHLVPVVRARSRVLLSLSAVAFLGGTLMVVGYSIGARVTSGWVAVGVPVVLLFALGELALRVVEARACGRYLERRPS